MKVMAALLTKTSRRPKSRPCGDHGHHLVLDGQVGGDGQAPPTGGLDRRTVSSRVPGVRWGGLGWTGRAGHVTPGPGQGHGGGRAHPAAGAGHQGHLPVEILHVRALLPCGSAGVRSCGRRRMRPPATKSMYVGYVMNQTPNKTAPTEVDRGGPVGLLGPSRPAPPTCEDTRRALLDTGAGALRRQRLPGHPHRGDRATGRSDPGGALPPLPGQGGPVPGGLRGGVRKVASSCGDGRSDRRPTPGPCSGPTARSTSMLPRPIRPTARSS